MTHPLIEACHPFPCGLITAEGQVLDGNAAFFSWLSLPPDVRLPPPPQPAWAASLHQALQEGRQETELASGQTPPLRFTFALLHSAAEHPPMLLLGIPPNLPAAQLAQTLVQTLARALEGPSPPEASLDLLARQTLAGVYVIQNNLIRFANPALARLFRFPSAQELAGNVSGDDLVIPAERGLVAEHRRRAYETGEARYGFTAQRLDGSPLRVEVHEQALTYQGQPALLGLLIDAADRQQLEREIDRHASYDELTGLPNRTLLFDRINQIIAHARRDDELFALLFLDLDHFQTFNARYGHEAGDRILRIVAGRFAAALRSSDTLARIGSDEFAVIAGELLFGDDVAPIAQKLCDALSTPLSLGTESLQLSVSIGVALFPAAGSNADALYRAAQAALQTAKDTCRGTYVFSGPGTPEKPESA